MPTSILSKKKLLFFLWLLANGLFAQESAAPRINILRAEESYLFLDSAAKNTVFLQRLKFIPFSKRKAIFISLGGEYRARVEHFSNENYTEKDLTYFSQRVSFHSSLQLGSKLRLFGELYSGFVPGNDPVFLESDEIDWHQGFLEWKPVSGLSLKIGRQEIGYGASRLVGIREGPNMRRSFDMARIIIRKKNSSLDLLYGKEVSISPFSFDNKSDIFKRDASSPSFWGAYFKRPFLKEIGRLELYYFGFYSSIARFNDAIGEEVRHSIGARSFGEKGRLSYNTELIVQFGSLGSSDVFAYNLETDWKIELIQKGWKPKIGLKLDWSSGDRQAGDGRVGTFNPLFVNPAIYSLAAVNTPANVTSIHPSFILKPRQNLSILIDYAIFYRTQLADGLYGPPRFQVREANGLSQKHIGDVFGLQISYALNRNISFDLRSSYFISGQFIEASGDSENTFYLAPTVSFKF